MNVLKNSFLPVSIDVSEMNCLIVGGGCVAVRKLEALLTFHASRITVVSPTLNDQFLEYQKKFTYIEKKYEAADLEGFDFVWCATDNPEVSYQVKEDCKSKKIMLNVADVPELSTFIMPATIQRGNFTIALASQGRAPFYALHQKKELEKHISPLISEVAEIANVYRKRIINVEKKYSTDEKQRMYKEFLKVDWEKILASKGRLAAFQKMQELLTEVE